VFGSGKGPAAHLFPELTKRRHYLLPQLPVHLHELGQEAVEQAEQILSDQYLAVAVWTGPDPDHRNPHPSAHRLRYLGGNALEHDGERTRLLELQGQVDQSLGFGAARCLGFEDSGTQVRLHRGADVGHDGNAGRISAPPSTSRPRAPASLISLSADSRAL
jgi:hypothetical protein